MQLMIEYGGSFSRWLVRRKIDNDMEMRENSNSLSTKLTNFSNSIITNKKKRIMIFLIETKLKHDIFL